MIDLFNCGYEPTEKEIQPLLKSRKPGQKLSLLNDLECQDKYINQLLCENYLDRLLDGYIVKFVTNRLINNKLNCGPYLTMNKRLGSMISEIHKSIERIDLYLRFKPNPFKPKFEGGYALLNYDSSFGGCSHDSDKCEENECKDKNCEKHCYHDHCWSIMILGHDGEECIVVGPKVNGNKIDCINYR